MRFFNPIRPFAYSMLLLLVLHSLLRFIFWSYNKNFFGDLSTGIPSWGFLMDLSSIAWINIPVFIFYFISQYPLQFRQYFLVLARILFVIVNLGGLAMNILDIPYYSYVKHRSNIDLVYVLGDSLGTFRTVILLYWPFILLFFMIALILISASKKIFRREEEPTVRILLINHFLAMIILFIFARGWQSRPLIPSSPLVSVGSRQLPVAQNSIHSFLYSLLRSKHQLREKKYFSKDQLQDLISISHDCCNGLKQDSFNRKNVIICILESFSAYYLNPHDKFRAKTPFFDSLISKSIFFPNAFANGFTSNQGIVAILGGLPALLDEPFYYSQYANTPLNSLGNILRDKGYNTNFFMGAGPDHFGFGKFCAMAGIDHYYSRIDFNNDKFYDGNWGIFDGPFLQFTSNVLEKKQEPFLAVIFNISSHPPFTIQPDQVKQFDFPGQTPAQKAISYVDASYRQFFSSIRNLKWFRNSIFVFCADHFYASDETGHYSTVFASSIPIFMYDPSKDQGLVSDRLVSQVDITPAILDWLDYKGRYSGYGVDPFSRDGKERFAINKFGSIYQILSTHFVLGYDLNSDKSQYLFNYKTDSLLEKNLVFDPIYKDTLSKLENQVRAYIQSYNHALINRSLE